MRTILLCGSLATALAWTAAADETVLVVHEEQNIETWRVSGTTWTRTGLFLEGEACPRPMCAAVAGGVVYVGDAEGRILRFAPDGTPKGQFAKMEPRCDALAVSPDGQWLYAARAFGKNANQILRYRLADGHGGVWAQQELATPRRIRFGADGNLYAASRGGWVTVFDASGAQARVKGQIPNGGSSGGLQLEGSVLWLPNGRRLRRLDLATGGVSGVPSDFGNCFSSVRAEGATWFVDWDGRVMRVDGAKVGTAGNVGEKACDVCRFSAALDGTAAREWAVDVAARAGRTWTFAFPEDFTGDFERLAYNSQGESFLKTGLICMPMPMDWDGDGDMDLVVANCGIPTWAGTFLFENPGTAKAGELPVFRPARKIGPPRWNISAKTQPDGRVAVTHCGTIARDFTKTGFDGFVPFKGLKANIHYNGVRCNTWRLVDFDGDGRDDLVVGVGDWTQYGWHNAYDEYGNWKNGQIHGHLYWIRNEAKSEGDEAWGVPELIRLENEQPVEVFGNPVAMLEDWDGDGDLDILCADFLDNFTYFENIGTRTKPVYTNGRLLRDPKGARLHADLCIVSPAAVDLDRDGKLDFVAGEEDGRVGFYRNTGRVVERMPVFEQPTFLRQEREDVHFGVLSTPAGVDWDGDGDWDIIAGNSAGYICFIENLSGPGVAKPKWAEPKLLTSVGKGAAAANRHCRIDSDPIRIWAGHNGSIQGPAEAQWGYTCLSVADWDGDGLPDVMVNSIWGDVLWFRNVGTRTQPQLGPAQDVVVEWEGEQPKLEWGWYQPRHKYNPKALLTQWRTSPVMYDWNGDGLMDLVMVDTEGYLCLFTRMRRGTELVLGPPRRVFLDERGEPLHPTARKDPKAWSGGIGGATGRRKICITDWDGDGKADLIMNGCNADLFLQVGEKDGTWSFRAMGKMGERVLAGHSTCPTTVDFDGNGVPDLLLGTEDGFFYTLKNEQWRK